jgi:hypothetical protein
MRSVRLRLFVDAVAADGTASEAVDIACLLAN